MLDCKWCRQSLSLSKRQNFHWCNKRLTVGFALFSSLRHVLIRSRAAVWIASMEGVRWRWSSITSGLKAKICTNHYQKNETHWALFDSLTVCNCQCRDKLWWLVKKIRDASLSYCRLLKTFHQLSQTTDFPHSFRKVVPKDTTNWPGSTLKQRLKSCKPIIKCVKPVKAWTIYSNSKSHLWWNPSWFKSKMCQIRGGPNYVWWYIFGFNVVSSPSLIWSPNTQWLSIYICPVTDS